MAPFAEKPIQDDPQSIHAHMHIHPGLSIVPILLSGSLDGEEEVRHCEVALSARQSLGIEDPDSFR